MHFFITTTSRSWVSSRRCLFRINPSSIFFAAIATAVSSSSSSWKQQLSVSAFHTTSAISRISSVDSANKSSSSRMMSSAASEVQNVIATIVDNTTNNTNDDSSTTNDNKIDVLSTSMTSKDFLLSYPSGAYTTARTCCDGTRIFEWEAHIQRTASSVSSMMQENDNNDSDDDRIQSTLTNPMSLRKRLDAIVRAAIIQYQETNSDKNTEETNKAKKDDSQEVNNELKITALVGWNTKKDGDKKEDDTKSSDNDILISCHISKLPSLPTIPVNVEIRGSPRTNAAAKDSSWVSDRAPLEELMKSADVEMNELLLTSEDKEIFEGSQTNFYAIKDNTTLYTADEGILKGTVRTIVLDVCQKHNIPVVLQPPIFTTDNNWDGALISSTSRLALPIDAIYIPKDGQPSKHPTDLYKEFNIDNSLAKRIQSLVAKEVEDRSSPIFP